MQLSSSLCPIGAFAYSQGLESAIERSWISDESTLLDWLSGVGGHALASLDMPLLLKAHRAWSQGDVAGALRVSSRLLSNRESRELFEQERQLGTAMARVLDTLGSEHAGGLLDSEQSSYVVMYALGAVHFGVEPDLAATGYAFAWCEQQVSAAARLVPLGHLASQRVLSQVLKLVAGWLNSAQRLPDAEIGSPTPALAMGAAWHETQYTRLFRS
jgi:urease accessory protein